MQIPKVAAVVNVELIRDGGSYAARFAGDDGEDYVALVQLKWDRSIFPAIRCGYEAPILIDTDPGKRPPPPHPGATMSVLAGPAVDLSWADLRELLRQMTEWLADHEPVGESMLPLRTGRHFSPNWRQWFAEMVAVAQADGAYFGQP